jgi:hypothetical protein
MAQITSVVSESLQAKVRALLPSQAGFTEDLQAQNVIEPIIDLTETASGSVLRQDLQTAIAFGSQTVFNVKNTTTTVLATSGFYRVLFVSFVATGTNTDRFNRFFIEDAAGSTVNIWEHDVFSGANVGSTTQGDFVIFLKSGDSFKVTSTETSCVIAGSVRQIADLTGNLVNPSGFTSE